MSVNKYKIRLGEGEKYINFPIQLTTTTVGQENIIENEFVKKETENAINDIVDHEKVRLEPKQNEGKIDRIDYNVNLLNGDSFPVKSTYELAGFVNDDIKFKRNNFKKSFLNLAFFDSDTPTNQNYLGNVTMFSKLSRFDMERVENNGGGSGSDGGENGDGYITATMDSYITDGLLFAKGGYYDYGWYVMDYVINGYAYNKVKRPNETHSTDDGLTFIGEEIIYADYINGVYSDLPVPPPMFGKMFLVDDNYQYNNKTYKVYSTWFTNIVFGGTELTNIYFVEVAQDDGDSEGEPEEETMASVHTRPKDVSNIPLRFTVEDPILTPKGFAEGFYLYHEKVNLPTSIFMRASFNNAKTGLSTDLITTSEPQDIDDIVGKLHTKYDLKMDGDTYYYELDTSYSNNIIVDGNNRLSIELYEIQVL